MPEELPVVYSWSSDGGEYWIMVAPVGGDYVVIVNDWGAVKLKKYTAEELAAELADMLREFPEMIADAYIDLGHPAAQLLIDLVWRMLGAPRARPGMTVKEKLKAIESMLLAEA